MGAVTGGISGLIIFEACTDCVLLIANGECNPDTQDQVAAGLEKNWADFHLCVQGHQDGCDGTSERCGCMDAWFSWQSCDGCGSSLGGDRLNVVAWPREVSSAVQ